MKDLLHKKSFRYFCITLGAICLVSLACSFGYPVLSSGTSTLTLGLSKASAAASQALDTPSYEELLEENQSLKEENSALREQLADYNDLQEENRRLWKFYDIKKENPTYTYVPATVIRRDANADFYSFTIDAGTSLKIKENDPVITENGLIGIIEECDVSTAKVKTILSPEIKVGARDSKTNDSGVIAGSGAFCDQNLTQLTKISADSKIKEGDVIVTSGVGGLFPSKLVIGRVKELSFDDYDASKYALVEPYEDIRKVSSVLVITDFDTRGQISAEKATQAPTEADPSGN